MSDGASLHERAPFRFPWVLWWLVFAVNVGMVPFNVIVGTYWLAPVSLLPIGVLLHIYYRLRWARQPLPPASRLSPPSGQHGKDNLT